MLSVVVVDKAGRRPLLLAGVSGIVSARGQVPTLRFMPPQVLRESVGVLV